MIILQKTVFLEFIFNVLFLSSRRMTIKKTQLRDFPGGTTVKNLPANAEDTGSIPGPGRSHMLRSN